MPDPDCKFCFGIGWVCENHPRLAWKERLGCQCGAGMPCECVRADRLEEPDISRAFTAVPIKNQPLVEHAELILILNRSTLASTNLTCLIKYQACLHDSARHSI